MIQPDMPFGFDRSKPFYPLVMSYIAQMHGLIELISRGAISIFQDQNASAEEIAVLKASDAETKERLSRLKTSGITELIGEMQFASRIDGIAVEFDINEMSKEILLQGIYIMPFFATYSSGVLLIASWELTEQYHDVNAPLWEFLRHCRNAAAHGGRFHFLGKEPSRPAQWRHLRLEKSLHGTLLFDTLEAKGLLAPGDALKLLMDIERANPQMTA